jgi:hypothetical protein
MENWRFWALVGSEWSASGPGYYTSGEIATGKNLVLPGKEAGRPACSPSLYRLSHPDSIA